MNDTTTERVLVISGHGISPRLVVTRGTTGFLHPKVEALFSAPTGSTIRLDAIDIDKQKLAAMTVVEDEQEIVARRREGVNNG